MTLMSYRHGWLVSDSVGPLRAKVDTNQARLWVCRLNNRLSVEGPITGEELKDDLGHRAPKHTVHYKRTAASRFEVLWR